MKLQKLLSEAAVDIVVIDSVAALVPKAEIEGDMGDSHVGLQARLMSQAPVNYQVPSTNQKQLPSLSTKFVKSWCHVW